MDTLEYHEFIKKFDKYPEELKIIMYALGLGGESGEVQEKVKKLYRDKNGVIDDDFKKTMVKELGDVLWYATMLCNSLGFSLDDVMVANMEKLELREKKNLIHGDGDDREENDSEES